MLVRREGDRGFEEDLLYIAGGSDRQVYPGAFSFVCICTSSLYTHGYAQGKCTDVRKLVLESKSQNYLRWNGLLGGGRKVNVDGDLAGTLFDATFSRSQWWADCVVRVRACVRAYESIRACALACACHIRYQWMEMRPSADFAARR